MPPDHLLPYHPSNDVVAKLAAAGARPRLRMVRLLTTKEVELRLQYSKTSAGPRMVLKLGGIPMDHVPTRKAMDEIWLEMLERSQAVIFGIGGDE
jgi:hypothetical protein